jgi:hypothetical protein
LSNSSCKQENVSSVDDAGGRKPEDLAEITEDVFQPMDGGIKLSPEEIKGRNTWNLWCAGTEQFWERMSRESYGLIDLLKTINSRGHLTRFKELGLINEPGFKQVRNRISMDFGSTRQLHRSLRQSTRKSMDAPLALWDFGYSTIRISREMR